MAIASGKPRPPKHSLPALPHSSATVNVATRSPAPPPITPPEILIGAPSASGNGSCFDNVHTMIASAQNTDGMGLDDYKVVLYRNQPDGWVAEVPAISGCYALMATREEALAELQNVFEVIAAEYREKGLALPVDTTEIVHA